MKIAAESLEAESMTEVKSKGKVKSVSAQGNPTKVATVSDCEGHNESSNEYTVTNSGTCTSSIGDIVEGLFNREEGTFQITNCNCSG